MNRLRPILLIAIVLLALGLVGGALAAARTAQAALVMPGAAGESQPQMSATRLSQPPANISRNDTLPPSPAKTGAVNAPASFSPQPGYFIAQLSPNKAGEWLDEAGVTAAKAGGDWDGATVYAPAVIQDDGEYRMYYTGTDLLGKSQIGLATSPDGISWTKSASNPLLAGSEAFVQRVGASNYVMWYNGPDGIYRATSADGLTWTAGPTPVLQSTGDDDSWERDIVSDPSIVIDASGVYWMFYEAGNFTTMNIAAVGAVTSDDGINWVRSRATPVIAPGNAGDWDEMATVDPAVVYEDGGFKLWFSGISNNWSERVIGYATSADGVDWTKDPANPVFSGDPNQWDNGQVTNQFVLPTISYAMWYSSNNQIGYVSSEDGITWLRTLSGPVLTTGDPGVIASVNYAHDWVIARSAPNTTVTVTLTSTTGTRYTQVGLTDGGGELRTFERPWDPGQPDISPGAVVTVETDTAMTEVDPVGTISGLVDGETDTVAGTVNASWFAPENLTVLCEVWVPDGPPAIEVAGVAADGGSFTCDFASVGWDILPGQDITVMYLEPDGDRVINVTAIPWTRVNFSHDWVGVNFPQGHTFWITVTDETGAVKATAEVETFANGGWGGEGFETTEVDWSPRQPDIQPGDWVNLEADTGYTNQVRVGILSGEVDAEDDQASGTVTAEWFIQPLNVECHPWGGPGSAQPKSSTAEPDGSTTYQCQWDSLNEWDILPGQDVAVMYIEPDNDRVVGVFHHPAPNLSIQTWMDGTPAEGGNVEFRVLYLNDGDGAAPGTVITATLDGLHYLSDTSSLPVTTGTTPDGDETVSWEVGNLPPGTLNHQFRLFAAVTRPAGSEVTNRVEIETSLNYSQWEPWRKENIWTGQVEPNDTHLNVGKNAWTGDPVAGEQFVWAVNACNNANTGSSELVVTDTLPISTTLVGWWGQHPGWSEVSRDDEELVLSRPALAGHQCSEVYLRFQLDEAAWVGMPISNTAEIFALSDSETGDNETTSWVWVSHPRTNLAAYKGWQWGQLVPGGDVYYELSYRNNGNLPVENVQLVNDLPEGMSFIGSWYNDELGEHPVTPIQVTAGQVVWDIGTLDNGFEGRLTIGLHIDEGTTPGTVLNQRVEISAPAAEQRYDDNSIAWVDTVNGAGANLRVTKQNYRWNGQGGIEYEIRVMNLGSQPLENVWITDTYPAETTFNNWWVNHGPSAMDGTSLPESHQVRYWIERLNPGDTASLGLGVNLDGEIIGEQGLSFTNKVNAPISGDTYPADNSDQVTAYTGPDVYVTKTLSSGQLRPGEIVTFTVHFGNRNQWPWDGDRDFGSHITETLAPEMTFISATAPWNPQEEWIPESIEGNTIVWGWGTMWNNSDWFFDVVVQIADSVEGGDVLTNRIQAFGDSPNDVEANWANNEFELPVTIQNPKFAVNKTYESSRVAGTVIKYMLAVNNTGNQAGTDLRLTDPLPGGVTYGGGGSLANGLVSWTVPSLAPGSQATSWFTGTLSCTAGTPINNQNYRVASSAEGVSSANGPAVTFTTQAPALSATFSASPQSAKPGETVQFTANATTNGTPLTYSWDFDDGTTATGKITSHTFTAPGDYKVTLQVKDACGFTKTYTATIHIGMHKLYLPMTLNGNKP